MNTKIEIICKGLLRETFLMRTPFTIVRYFNFSLIAPQLKEVLNDLKELGLANIIYLII